MQQNDEQEVKEEPKQIGVKNSVQILLKAYELAKTATNYKASQNVQSRSTKIYFDGGNQMKEDPTLAHFIEIAESRYVELSSTAILKTALLMLENEIDAIRRLVNG